MKYKCLCDNIHEIYEYTTKINCCTLKYNLRFLKIAFDEGFSGLIFLKEEMFWLNFELDFLIFETIGNDLILKEAIDNNLSKNDDFNRVLEQGIQIIHRYDALESFK